MTHLWLCIFVSPCIAMLTDIDLGKILTSNLDFFIVVLHLIPNRFNCIGMNVILSTFLFHKHF